MYEIIKKKYLNFFYKQDYKVLEDIPKLVDRYLEGKLPIDDFITGNYKLEEINEAVDQMKAGKS